MLTELCKTKKQNAHCNFYTNRLIWRNPGCVGKKLLVEVMLSHKNAELSYCKYAVIMGVTIKNALGHCNLQELVVCLDPGFPSQFSFET